MTLVVQPAKMLETVTASTKHRWMSMVSSQCLVTLAKVADSLDNEGFPAGEDTFGLKAVAQPSQGFRRLLVVVLVLLMVACGGGPLPWTDDFSDPASGWQAETDASAEVGYHEGAMRVLVKAPHCLAWASAGREVSDFRLAVEATQVAGPDDNEYGVLVRMRDADHFYRFSISGDGYYLVSKYDGGAWEVLNGDWAYSDAIHLGAATNVLEVVCQGAAMTFLVNGVQLVQVEDGGYPRGDVGLYAGSFFEPGVEVHFDGLSVAEP